MHSYNKNDHLTRFSECSPGYVKFSSGVALYPMNTEKFLHHDRMWWTRSPGLTYIKKNPRSTSVSPDDPSQTRMQQIRRNLEKHSATAQCASALRLFGSKSKGDVLKIVWDLHQHSAVATGCFKRLKVQCKWSWGWTKVNFLWIVLLRQQIVWGTMLARCLLLLSYVHKSLE